MEQLYRLALGVVGVLFALPFVNAQEDELKMIYDYCVAHADEIVAGNNPIQTLIDSGLISSSTYTGQTCAEVKHNLTMAEINREYGERMSELAKSIK